LSPSGTIWLGSADRPSVAITAVSPSSSGTPAATSAPKASSRMTSVIGSESFSALPKSSLNAWESALDALAEPNSPTWTPGFARATRCTPSTIGEIASSAWVAVPRSLNVTSTERPSRETWPACR
jgi:hypothetical protein